MSISMAVRDALWRPWKALVAISLVAAYVLTTHRGQWPISSFLGNFCAAWLLQFAAWAVWANQLYPKLFSPLRHLPQPKGASFFNGMHWEIISQPTGTPMVEWVNTIPNNGLIYFKSLLNIERIMPTSPKALAEILVTKNYDFDKPSDFRYFLGRMLGIGILLAEGDEHRHQRKTLSPAFAFRHIKDLVPVFWEKSIESVLAMTAQVDDDAAQDPSHGPRTSKMEVGGWASRVTLDIIGVAGLGRDFGAIADPDTELTKMYNNMFKPSRQGQLLGILGLVLPGWVVGSIPVARNNDIEGAAKFIRATCRDLIREKKEKMLQRKKDGSEAAGDVDILSVALESGGFSDENLVDQLMTFLAAGHETTASAMTWAVYLLSRDRDAQDRLRAEVREHLPPPESGRPVTSVDFDRMPYLNAVVNEVLRYFAPAPITARVANKDTTVLGQFVPKGTRVMLAPQAVNKSTELWGSEAGRFNPDRWLDPVPGAEKGDGAVTVNNNGGASSNYAFLTFLHGPRSCIGSLFAKAEFACLLAAWIGRFEFSLQNEEEMDESKLDIKGGITARPANGMNVYAKIVDGW